MAQISIALLHPPVAKPSEAPAGVARLAGALKAHGVRCKVIDANIRGLHHLLHCLAEPRDTWGKRARRHLDSHIANLRSARILDNFDRYKRAIADINHLLSAAGRDDNIRVGLADYHDRNLSPVRSADLLASAQAPERNPFFGYYQNCLLPEIRAFAPDVVGLSINYLAQALSAFALIGLIRRQLPEAKIVIGGGLVTSWHHHGNAAVDFGSLVHRMVAGPGEQALLEIAGIGTDGGPYRPDYASFAHEAYLAPGTILPFSASHGCWWRRCAFCPERAEGHRFKPLAHSIAVEQLKDLTRAVQPGLIHLLDNALSPALLKSLAAHPPGAPWYGFARFAAPLDAPEFCRNLAAAGCVMLKLGLESGDQKVLDALHKGIRLETASRVLNNLYEAGIAAYVYLLFGTPAEDEAAAQKTLRFVSTHSPLIDFLNTAVFNLPQHSPDSAGLKTRDFYPGDMALYKDFEHPQTWSRASVRRFLEKEFKRHPSIRPILLRDPPVFTSNHAPFFLKRCRFFDANSHIGE